MRKIIIGTLILLLGGMVSLADARGVGTSAANFLKAGVGARPSGMGGAFVALANDLNSLEWNPAGLSSLPPNVFNASFEHVFWFDDVEYEILSLGQYLGDTYGAGIQAQYRHMPDIDNNLEDEKSVKVFDFTGTLGFGLQISNFCLGLNLKVLDMYMGTEALFGTAADIGLQVFFLERKLALGLVIQNIGPDVKSDSLPLNIRGGAGYTEHFGDAKEHILSAGLELNQPLDNKLNLQVGLEYWYLQMFAARVGYKQQLGGYDLQSDNFIHKLTAGASARWADLQLDYGFATYADLGGTHRLTLTVHYGPLKDELEK